MFLSEVGCCAKPMKQDGTLLLPHNNNNNNNNFQTNLQLSTLVKTLLVIQCSFILSMVCDTTDSLVQFMLPSNSACRQQVSQLG